MTPKSLYYMAEDALDAYARAAAGVGALGLGPSAAPPSFDDFFVSRAAPVLAGNVGVITVKGTLTFEAIPALAALGLETQYSQIIAEVDALRALGATAFAFDFASPGGTVLGAMEAAAAIRDIAEPTAAVTSSIMTSGAYYLAAGTDFIAATPSAIVGSIGVISVRLDQTAALERLGLRVDIMTNEGADLKAAGSFPMSDDQREFLQETLDQAGDNFRGFVESERTVAAEVFRAGFYSGPAAFALGLVDAPGTLDETVAALAD